MYLNLGKGIVVTAYSFCLHYAVFHMRIPCELPWVRYSPLHSCRLLGSVTGLWCVRMTYLTLCFFFFAAKQRHVASFSCCYHVIYSFKGSFSV